MRVNTEQGRVIGSLIEKQLTTPQQYPLTLNALVLACNQSSNRDPIVAYEESTVDATLTSLKETGLVRFVHPSHGRSVTRYRQVLEERLALSEEQLALLGVLLLRGSQTIGELRGRTERMASFEGIASVESELRRLSVLPGTPRQPAAPPPGPEGRTVGRVADRRRRPPTANEGQGRATASGLAGEVADLRQEVAGLAAQVAELRATLEQLEARPLS